MKYPHSVHPSSWSIITFHINIQTYICWEIQCAKARYIFEDKLEAKTEPQAYSF